MNVTIDQKELSQVIDFIIEVDKLKAVTRKVKPLHCEERYENSAEHSWQITLLALSLSQYCNNKIDINRVISMLLVHDIGEIDTGDTMFFVEGGWKERKADELKAVERIFSYLPKETATKFVALWEEFENGETEDSKFANAIDRVMPALLNINNNGQSWNENGISYATVVRKIQPPIEKGFPQLWEYMEAKLAEAKEKGLFPA